MLNQIHIKNFAIVKELVLDLKQGLSVITGETGAGKSIVLSAFAMCLGGRYDSKITPNKGKRIEVSAVFTISHHQLAKNWLANTGLDNEDECIIRRTISVEGRSQCYINGSVVPISQVKSLASLLVNIHGQHENQTLLHPRHYTALLDKYGEHEALVLALSQTYTRWKKSIGQHQGHQ